MGTKSRETFFDPSIRASTDRAAAARKARIQPEGRGNGC